MNAVRSIPLHAEHATGTLAGYFADRLPTREPSLRDLWLAAADAADAISRGYSSDLSEYEMDRLEDARSDAEHALRDRLLTDHGLTTADLKRNVL